jgi:hypothetical protein
VLKLTFRAVYSRNSLLIGGKELAHRLKHDLELLYFTILQIPV